MGLAANILVVYSECLVVVTKKMVSTDQTRLLRGTRDALCQDINHSIKFGKARHALLALTYII